MTWWSFSLGTLKKGLDFFSYRGIVDLPSHYLKPKLGNILSCSSQNRSLSKTSGMEGEAPIALETQPNVFHEIWSCMTSLRDVQVDYTY